MKNHIFIFWNQKLLVDNSELLNLHKRLSIQYLIIADSRPIFTLYQHLHTLGAEVCFTRMVVVDGVWRVTPSDKGYRHKYD